MYDVGSALYFWQEALYNPADRRVLACNSGRDTHKANRSGQRMGMARWGLAVRRREALQKATYLHGGVEERRSEECSPCVSWNQQQRMLNSDSGR